MEWDKVKQTKERLENSISKLNKFVHSYYDVKEITEEEQQHLDKSKELIEKYKNELKEIYYPLNMIRINFYKFNFNIDIYLLDDLKIKDYTYDSFALTINQLLMLDKNIQFDIDDDDQLQNIIKIPFTTVDENDNLINLNDEVLKFSDLKEYYLKCENYPMLITLKYLFEVAQKDFTKGFFRGLKKYDQRNGIQASPFTAALIFHS